MELIHQCVYGPIEMSEQEHGADGEAYGESAIIADVLGGGARVKILAVFLGDHDKDLSPSDIARMAGVDRATFYRHIDDLRAWGLVEQTRTVGNSTMYQLNKNSEAAKKLAGFEWELIEYLSEKESKGEISEENRPVLSDE